MVDSPRPLSTTEWLAKYGGESRFVTSDLGRAGESRQSPLIGYKRHRARVAYKRMMRRQQKAPPPD